MRNLSERWEIADPHPWIGEHFREDDARVWPHRRLHRLKVGDLNRGDVNAARREVLGEENLADDEEVIRNDQVIAALEVRKQAGGDCRHAGG